MKALPEGWAMLPESYFHDREKLNVHMVDGKWRLFHWGQDTGHAFDTLAEAIDYAEDVIYHAG
jgi:hypothetical protein